jgi:hypothetical protein
MTTDRVAATTCDHAYDVRMLGGHPLSVRICTLCGTPDWRDLTEQANGLFRWGRAEALAGSPLREHLSAYEKPREADNPTVPPAGRDLRDRIAQARTIVNRLAAHAKGFQDVLDESDRNPWARLVRADIDNLAKELAAAPAAPVDSAVASTLREVLAQFADWHAGSLVCHVDGDQWDRWKAALDAGHDAASTALERGKQDARGNLTERRERYAAAIEREVDLGPTALYLAREAAMAVADAEVAEVETARDAYYASEQKLAAENARLRTELTEVSEHLGSLLRRNVDVDACIERDKTEIDELRAEMEQLRADRAAVLREAANGLAALGPVDSLVSAPAAWTEAIETLRRMADQLAADEAQQADPLPLPDEAQQAGEGQ